MRAEHRFPDHMGRPYPTAFVHLDPATGLTGGQVIERLLAGDPAVAVMGHDDPQVVRVDVRVLEDEDAALVAGRLRAVLQASPGSSLRVASGGGIVRRQVSSPS